MAGKKVAKLAKGSAIVVTDRLWALVNAQGRLTYSCDGRPHIYSTRAQGEAELRYSLAATHVVRLADITGTVYK